MTCETCTYRFECEHADAYYLPGGADIGNTESFAATLDRGNDRNIGSVFSRNKLQKNLSRDRDSCKGKLGSKRKKIKNIAAIPLEEIQAAKKALIESQQALDYADEDFIETAVYQQKMAETRFNALLRRIKAENKR